MQIKETKIHKGIAYFLRMCILILFLYQIFCGEFQSLHYFIVTFIFTYFNNILAKWGPFHFSDFINSFISIFVFLSQILGRVYEFYIIFSFWDIFLHTLAGILFYYIGKELILYFNRRSFKQGIVIFFCICFSLAIGVLWELFEFIFDQVFHMNMQEARGLIGVDAILDTMSDLVVLTLGAILSALFNYVRRILSSRKN